MMKTLLSAIILLFSIAMSAQENSGVKLTLSSEAIKLGQGLQFTVSPAAPHQLEVAVFSDTQVVFFNRTLLSSDNVFDVPAKDLHPGKYYVLVTAEGIHEQQTFWVKE
ncbi:MAG: hypothetical protein IT223_00235 [Crocinitomicaceae bacterium]|nr:hypothetical protein [Crocinitomicaceae bacterium]